MAQLIKTRDIAAKFNLPDDEVASRLIRACAGNEITAWAGRAVFTEGDISHSETDWQVPPEAWISPSGLSVDDTGLNRRNPFFSPSDGTLRGQGFSPLFPSGKEPAIVDVKSISFFLTRLVFDLEDLIYLFGGERSDSLPSAEMAGDASRPGQAPKSAKRLKGVVGAKPDVTRWEQFAAAFVVLWDKGELNIPSEAAIHKRVADYLAERGHDNAYGVDNVRSFIRRVKTWSEGHPFHGDADYEE